jgi:hypothetical protein
MVPPEVTFKVVSAPRIVGRGRLLSSREFRRAGLLVALLLLFPLAVASRASAQSVGTTLMPYGTYREKRA